MSMFNFLKKFTNSRGEWESLEDQKGDMRLFPEKMQSEVLNGEDCDEIDGATGEFGKIASNPIPVNGPIGEIKYLNRLRTNDGGLLFHRVGCMELKSNFLCDVFEVVSIGGKNWDILYFHMYHPRRSNKVPTGFGFAKLHPILSKLPFGFGSTFRDANFPYGLGDEIEESGGKRLREHYLEIIKNIRFVRPEDHLNRLKEVVSKLAPTSYYRTNIAFP
jgi:hypothetical protein